MQPEQEPAPEGEEEGEGEEWPEYWEYRGRDKRWRWFPREWEWRGEWGQWWEVWVAVEGGSWAPLRGHFDGAGHGRRRDQWRWRRAW